MLLLVWGRLDHGIIPVDGVSAEGAKPTASGGG